MTGLERNGDHVIMASYAPLFCHPGWKRWNPNAIVFSPTRAYGTPSYHVQTLFGANRGDFNLPVELDLPSLGPAARPALFAVAGRDGKSGETILKVANASAREIATSVAFKGSTVGAARGWVLTAASPDDENSFEQPQRVAPKPVALEAAKGPVQHAFPAYSVTVLRFASGARRAAPR
jgi:alpha-N-arabinofuranosidase